MMNPLPHHKCYRVRASVIPLLGLLTLTLHGADWSRFRGPDGQGKALDADVPVTWTATTGIAWKTPLPGAGGSSPVVFGKKIFLTSFSGYGVPGESGGSPASLKRHVLCLERKTGRVLWQKDIPAAQPEEEKVRDHGYAENTPLADAEHLYVFLGKSGVFAFTHEGDQLWHTDVGSGTHGWGSGSSPIVHDDLLIVNACVESESLVALNRETGREVWRARGLKESWNTPILVPTADGRTELVLAIFGKVLGVDPKTGESLWSCATDIGWYMVPSLVNQRDLIACTGGRGGGGTLVVRAGGRGDVTGSRRLWKISKGSNVPSPILHEDHLYWFDPNLGIVTCVEMATGKVVFEKRLDRAGQIYASPVLAGGKIYAVTRGGTVFVIAAKPRFELLARNDLHDGGGFDASPAVLDAALLIRSDRFLYGIGKP
ncbi:MAG: PQQ-binding-like beta-propeller repeat protein [Verrucomicrobiales bacterium]|nr:PQQ-binding-like beta-propeller repeat protein [Verrucomicrobiales bacterium]